MVKHKLYAIASRWPLLDKPMRMLRLIMPCAGCSCGWDAWARGPGRWREHSGMSAAALDPILMTDAAPAKPAHVKTVTQCSALPRSPTTTDSERRLDSAQNLYPAWFQMLLMMQVRLPHPALTMHGTIFASAEIASAVGAHLGPCSRKALVILVVADSIY